MKSIYILSICLLFTKTSFANEEHNQNYLETGISKMKLGMLLQNWATYDKNNINAKSNFRLRRSEIKFSGSVSNMTSFVLMIDQAKNLKSGAIDSNNDNKILQDFSINFSLDENFELTTGQFKIPTTAESLISSGSLILPERSVLSRNYGDKRELGLKLTYKKDIYKFQAMLSNGTKTNTDDTNTKKDLNFRADINPVKNLNIGLFATLIDGNSKKLKYGTNLFWDGKIESFHFEYARDESNSVSGVKKSKAYNFDIGYFINEDWQSVIRFEKLNFNRTNSEIESSVTTLGINYFIRDSNVKIQLATLFMNNLNFSNGTYDVSSVDSGNANGYTANLQIAF